MPRQRTYIASLLGVALLAVPALPVTIGNTAWTTSGRSIAKVKGLGKSKGDADLLLTFFTGGDVRVEDAFEHTGDLREGESSDPRSQGASLEVLHRDGGDALELEELVDDDDIRMAERGGHPRLDRGLQGAPLDDLLVDRGLAGGRSPGIHRPHLDHRPGGAAHRTGGR